MKYLKWNNTVIAQINTDNSIDFLNQEFVELTNPDAKDLHWSSERFAKFLDDRIVSRQRRDIEKILFRCGLSSYDVFKIADQTKAINAKDLFWISNNENDTFENAIDEVFSNIFIKKVDAQGDTIASPDGCNIKRYGVHQNKYGIYKDRLHPLSTDIESEVAVYHLAKKLGVPCCPAIRTDENTIFSQFEYNFAKEQIIHFRRLFEDGERKNENELTNLLSKRPEFKNDFYRMIFLDFITLQDDRHLSNFAIKIDAETREEKFYPLYDNGRSLFYQDNEKTMINSCENPVEFCTTFGASGTYYDHIEDILKNDSNALSLINLNITDTEIFDIMKYAGFEDSKLEYIVKWVSKSIDILKKLSV